MNESGVIRIEGCGPVALALRLLLVREGYPARLICAEEPEAALPGWLAARPIALSLGSLQLLGRVVRGLAPHVLLADSASAAPILKVAVTRNHTGAGLNLDRADLSEPVLGAVIRYGRLVQLLQESVAASPPPAAGKAGRAFELNIIADGEISPQTPRQRDFGQMALLAEVTVSRDEPGVAFEHFTSEGPLALLPLPEAGRRALVWCAPEASARARVDMPPTEFAAALSKAFGARLGQIALSGARHTTALSRRIAPILRDPRSVAIGNAAQVLHPVAGQGLNLGLRDAYTLARELGNSFSGDGSIEKALARFVRLRQADREIVVATTDLLAWLTCPDLLRPVHALALTTIDSLAPLRRSVARVFMHGPRFT